MVSLVNVKKVLNVFCLLFKPLFQNIKKILQVCKLLLLGEIGDGEEVMVRITNLCPSLVPEDGMVEKIVKLLSPIYQQVGRLARDRI